MRDLLERREFSLLIHPLSVSQPRSGVYNSPHLAETPEKGGDLDTCIEEKLALCVKTKPLI